MNEFTDCSYAVLEIEPAFTIARTRELDQRAARLIAELGGKDPDGSAIEFLRSTVDAADKFHRIERAQQLMAQDPEKLTKSDRVLLEELRSDLDFAPYLRRLIPYRQPLPPSLSGETPMANNLWERVHQATKGANRPSDRAVTGPFSHFWLEATTALTKSCLARKEIGQQITRRLVMLIMLTAQIIAAMAASMVATALRRFADQGCGNGRRRGVTQQQF